MVQDTTNENCSSFWAAIFLSAVTQAGLSPTTPLALRPRLSSSCEGVHQRVIGERTFGTDPASICLFCFSSANYTLHGTCRICKDDRLLPSRKCVVVVQPEFRSVHLVSPSLYFFQPCVKTSEYSSTKSHIGDTSHTFWGRGRVFHSRLTPCMDMCAREYQCSFHSRVDF